MAIEKYVTKCIVVEAFDNGEHDKAYKLFTREHGLVMAHARSVRKLESKLRAHIMPRTVSLVTLVQGREVWRLVGAEELPKVSAYIHEVTQLLKRFIRGEGAHKALYDRMVSFLEVAPRYEEQKARLLLYYILLVELGYADAKVVGAKDIKEYVSWSVDDLYTHILLSQSAVRAHVQAVLKEMQL
jgi:recombinational DNA repair protein (RecF pathway)